MYLFVVAFCAASAGATLGLLICGWIELGKCRDVETAYHCLSERVRQFLGTYPAGSGVLPTSQDERLALRKALNKSDSLVHPRWQTGARPADVASADKCPW